MIAYAIVGVTGIGIGLNDGTLPLVFLAEDELIRVFTYTAQLVQAQCLHTPHQPMSSTLPRSGWWFPQLCPGSGEDSFGTWLAALLLQCASGPGL